MLLMFISFFHFHFFIYACTLPVSEVSCGCALGFTGPVLFLPGLYVLEVLSASYTLFFYSLFFLFLFCFTFHGDS